MSSGEQQLNTVKQIPQFAALVAAADHMDIKTIEGEVSLRQFIAGFIGYLPPWVKLLYGVRMLFVRLLGMRQERIPQKQALSPEDIPFQPGQKLAFFDVHSAEEERFFIAVASESHLAAYLGFVAEPIDERRRRFYVVTIVHYHRWTGPVYFNVIRPFHHLVVGRMTRAGIG